MLKTELVKPVEDSKIKHIVLQTSDWYRDIFM